MTRRLPDTYLYRRGVLTTEEFLGRGGSLDDPLLTITCGCESLYCDHNEGGVRVEPGTDSTQRDLIRVLPCRRAPTGRTKMLWIGDVCDICADNMIASGGAANITRESEPYHVDDQQLADWGLSS